MKVLVACEFSGVVRDAFIAAGHDAMSCDLLPTEAPGPHYEGDVRDVIRHGWDLMVAHPPGERQAQVVQPWMFGHTERKGVALWLKNLPRLEPTNDVQAQMLALPHREQHRIHWMGATKDRWKLRSVTYQGLADAMAVQWGSEDLTTMAGAA